jgi:hypothetical protein
VLDYLDNVLDNNYPAETNVCPNSLEKYLSIMFMLFLFLFLFLLGIVVLFF